MGEDELIPEAVVGGSGPNSEQSWTLRNIRKHSSKITSEGISIIKSPTVELSYMKPPYETYRAMNSINALYMQP